MLIVTLLAFSVCGLVAGDTDGATDGGASSSAAQPAPLDETMTDTMGDDQPYGQSNVMLARRGARQSYFDDEGDDDEHDYDPGSGLKLIETCDVNSVLQMKLWKGTIALTTKSDRRALNTVNATKTVDASRKTWSAKVTEPLIHRVLNSAFIRRVSSAVLFHAKKPEPQMHDQPGQRGR